MSDLAYHLIEIVDHLNVATKRLLEPIVASQYIPDPLKREATTLIINAETLTEQIVDQPNIETLHDGLGQLRSEVEQFMVRISALAKIYDP